jgi:hypothetical protein
MTAAVPFTVDQLEAAVVAAASCARWPDGSLLLELDEDVLRTQLVPQVLRELATSLPPTVGPAGWAGA